MSADWQFGSLQMFGHQLIVADPPWDFENYSAAGTLKGADQHYRVMSLDDIKALRVHELAGADCLLLLWSTGCMLPQCLDVMKAWGFAFKSEMIWRKVFPSGKIRMGTGYRVRTMHEPIMLGTVGNPQHKPFPSILDGVAREHSRKPEEFYALIDKCCPQLQGKADLFSRTLRDGWNAWGDEIGKFEAAA
jgi:N6-adenosine-specific RNA methylase IME4